MAPAFRSLCISAALLATAVPSHAAVSHQLSEKEQRLATLLLYLIAGKGDQPTYGFSTSSVTHSGSGMLLLTGNHHSVANGILYPGWVGGGTLTLATNGLSESGSLQLNSSYSGVTNLSTGYLSSSSSSAIAWLRTIPDDRGSWLESNGGRLVIPSGTLHLSPSEFERLRSRSGNTFLTDYHYDASTGSLTLVPEPSALLLGGLGSLALLRRRRAA